MNVDERQKIERTIVELIIDSALSQGYAISINNGGDENEISKSVDKENILDNMFATDDEKMLFHVCKFAEHHVSGEPPEQIFEDVEFWVELVYGNDGYDVISDYLINQHSIGVLAPVEKEIAAMEEAARG